MFDNDNDYDFDYDYDYDLRFICKRAKPQPKGSRANGSIRLTVSSFTSCGKAIGKD